MTALHKKITTIGDTTMCLYCGKAWDNKDPDVPECSDTKVAISIDPAAGKTRPQPMFVPNTLPVRAFGVTYKDRATVIYASSEEKALGLFLDSFVDSIPLSKVSEVKAVRFTAADDLIRGNHTRVEVNPSIIAAHRDKCMNDGHKYHVLSPLKFVTFVAVS